MKTPSRPRLSVTILVINDQDNLQKCLQAVKDLAAEIIVGVDDQTTDGSVKVARRFTKGVFVLPHQDNFHLNKKIVNTKATGDWVLSLDADEFVTKKLATSITALLEGRHFGFDSWRSSLKAKLNWGRPPQALTTPATAYYLTRKNFFLGRYLKHAGQYPDPITRLYQRGQAVWPAEDVHEQMTVNGRIGWLTGDLDHYATPQFSRYLARENRYSSLTAQQLYRQGVTINALSFLDYFLLKPMITFTSLYFRYRGLLDGFPGWVFSLFSAIHWQLAYMKLWEIYKNK